MNEVKKSLHKSRDNKMIAGICGGIGEYFNIDPTIIRVVWAVFGCTGAGIIAYFVAALIMPQNPND